MRSICFIEAYNKAGTSFFTYSSEFGTAVLVGNTLMYVLKVTLSILFFLCLATLLFVNLFVSSIALEVEKNKIKKHSKTEKYTCISFT